MSLSDLETLLSNQTAWDLLTPAAQNDLLREYSLAQNAQQNADADTFFLIVMGMIVFFMQAGFALLEAGSVRDINTTNILLKNFLDACIGAISYWFIGWALAYGRASPDDEGNPFIGTGQFFLIGVEDYASVFFQFVFAATAATIVSGAMAERTDFRAYMVYSIVITAFVYPVVSHWGWDSAGWLAQGGYIDYAGSGIVHSVGGTAALVGAIAVGPRIGAWEDGGIKGHSTTLVALGGFILWFGFFAFNGGSELAVSGGSAAAVGLVIMNTTLAGAGGAVVSFIIAKFVEKKWSLLLAINGNLAGMVAICAGVAQVYPWAALVIGMIAAPVYWGWSLTLKRLKIDDPLDAVAVHLGCGFWGVLAAPLFSNDPSVSVFYGGQFYNFGWNLAGELAIISWSAVLAACIFVPLKFLGYLRVSEEAEAMGADEKKHKEPAYPYQPTSPSSSGFEMKKTNTESKDEAKATDEEKKI